jgi:hypothetical protein
LGFRWHISYFIEKQRAAISLFKATYALLRSASKRSFLMAKQLRFDQFLRNSGYVKWNERSIAARAVAV